MYNKRYDLVKIIKNDLILNGKIHLILFIAIIISSSCVVIIVHKTRLLITQEDDLIIKKNIKQNEWRNLIIEKNALSIPDQSSKK